VRLFLETTQHILIKRNSWNEACASLLDARDDSACQKDVEPTAADAEQFSSLLRRVEQFCVLRL
jgi:hypothetical protein